MSEITDKIKAHYEALGSREIPVPEWGVTIYASPVTAAERTRIYSGAKGENDYSVLVRMLIVKARNKDGSPMFAKDDEPVLLQKADSAVIIRVATEIMSGGPPAAELKN